jgi:N-acetylglucosamine malate deacetylase 1
MKLDILAFAAHPDDVELSCSGTILKHIALGKKCGIIDLTQGELGTRGNAKLRAQEAAQASKILGISVRENLKMKDGFFANDSKHQQEIIKKLRHYQPEIVLCNAVSDRHPDHGRAAKLISEACFYGGLTKIKTTYNGKSQKAWRPKAVYHYIQDRYLKPDFVVDVTPYVEYKMNSIKAYKSQFYDSKSKEPATPISVEHFLDFVKAKMMVFGRDAGYKYAEGFTAERTVGVNSLYDLI